MAEVRFELNRKGVRELLRSEEVQQMLAGKAQRRMPDGCKVDTQAGKNRANARITAVTDEARRDNLKNNTLLKAIGGKSA